MRSTSLPKTLLVAALGCVILSGCGVQNAATDRTPAGSTVSATTPVDAPPSDSDPEMRFLALMTRITQGCAPDAPSGGGRGSGGVPAPEDLPGWESAPPPRYGPGETPPGVPNADGDIPVPLEDPGPSKPTSDSTGPKPVKEVPLTGIEMCSGNEHAKRVSEAFKNTRTTSYQAMQKKLVGLDYPASRIHRMPSPAGVPRARLDLRMMGSHVVVEISGTSSGVITETFGAPETEDVKVTEVKRKPKPDAPTS
ncbi:hypothetical protein J7E93_35380 [Streptomyces sp. ISL-36]|uniref:hypothetical protein n=1 Tax=Streptomyces sp. ISL-36 TaxID=2819182 RepID=UPI001BE88B00|nr:hypothetical protein [Streptomyces sp. ISL-36]MBT2445277.1 hypothetical protein [Streptomyces sp. ISL-36]